MHISKLVMAALIASLGSAVALADTTVSTAHNDDIYYLGVSDTQTYGQTFAAAGDTLLSYEFSLNNFGTTDQDFGFYLATWTGSDVGTILYNTSLSIGAGSGDVSFLISPSLSVTPGDSYIAFVSTSEYSQLSDSYISQAGSDDSYADGSFLFLNNGTDTTQWTSAAWSSWTVPQTAFTARFSSPAASVPAPSAIIPMALGALSLGMRRRTKQVQGVTK